MKKPYYLLLAIATSVISCTTTYAQEKKVQFALTAFGSIKYQFLPSITQNYSLFGQAGIGIAAKVNGNTEGALSFFPKLSFVRENTQYRDVSSREYIVETINLVFNPEIIFPTRYERLQVTAGIGADWMADMGLVVHSSSYYQGATGDLNAAYDTISAARRRLIPFVSVGILVRVRQRGYLQLFARQDIRNAFPENSYVTFGRPGSALRVDLAHQPTRLGLGFVYIF